MASPASVDVASNALPPGHRLDEFELRGVIGVGGFGIVYRAFDHSLQREVAIKEYLPASLAGRSSRQQVSLLSHAHADTFAVGLQSFVNEARLLARFDHPSLVKVHRFWQDNGTAYMAMPLYPGRTLRALRVAAPDEAWLRRLLEHLLGALEVMHREGVYHRDIAPDNILLSEGSAPVLLDFGAARRVISDRSQTLTAILKPSYAPIEQYAESTGLRQGPWTDFYALGATLHFLITGKPPLPATARTLSDDQPRLAGSSQGGLSDTLLQVCDWMIAPRPGDRPQNVSEIRAALAGRLPVPQRERPASDTSWRNTEIDPAAPEALPGAPVPSRQQLLVAQRRRARAWRWAALGAIGGAALAIAAVWSLRDATSAATQASAADAPAVARAATPVATIAATATNAAPVDTAAPVVPTTAQAAAPTTPATTATTTPATGAGDASSRPAAVDGEPRDAATSSSSGDSAAATIAVPPPRPSARRFEAGATPRPAVRRATPAVAEPPNAAADTASTAPPAPAPPAVVAAGSPRDQCGGRHLIALHRCLVRECEKPAYQDHPQCQKVRAIEERTRRTINAS